MSMGRLFRKVIRLTALDSPNVRREQARLRGDPQSAWPAAVPGVVTYEELQIRLATWDAERIEVGIHARFYEGATVRLFPAGWLDHSNTLAALYEQEKRPRKALAVGIDPGQGDADTSMTAVDWLGVVEERAVKTPDPGRAVDEIRDFVQTHDVSEDRACMDIGGGGREIAAWLRRQHGLRVRTVGFGESVSAEPRRGRRSLRERKDEKDERYAFTRRRDQLFWELRELLNPAGSRGGFAIPARYHELRRQLAPFPLVRDGEGRLCLPPKSRKPGTGHGGQKSLVELIGQSPDRADSLALGVHALLHEKQRARVSFG
jgi:hypothetical protein